jgi:5,5'-dehydrodivanillate O-demethylase
MWTRQDGRRWIEILPQLDCNWFQVMENSADLVHLVILHQDSGNQPVQSESTQHILDLLEGFEGLEANEFEHGSLKRLKFADRSSEGPPVVFPNILCLSDCTEIRVPIDDTHTYHVRIYFEPRAEASPESELPVVYEESYKSPPDALHPTARFHKWWERPVRNPVQDYMAWETQGPIMDRTKEHLAMSDRAVVLFRQIMRREIEKVGRGLDPLGVIRTPDHPVIDTTFGVLPPIGPRRPATAGRPG